MKNELTFKELFVLFDHYTAKYSTELGLLVLGSALVGTLHTLHSIDPLTGSEFAFATAYTGIVLFGAYQGAKGDENAE